MTARQCFAPLALLACASFAPRAFAQQAVDSAYSLQITELTPTDSHWKFTTELVSSLPASATVPTPLKVLGYVPGTIGRLSRTEDLNRYFRAVEAASPRVKVFSLGLSEEGREMIVAAVADEATIKRLDEYRAMAARLADPRGESEADRARLIHEAKPIYWLTGTIHAPETGSPEMLMELLYRLAVEETPFVQKIRNNVITLITPATEVDGRNRIVDIIEEEKQLKLGRGGISTVYWGKYIAHDNNRDGLMMSIKLTQNMNSGFLFWRPTIMHDLHESVPFLYTSTGTGPYNDEFDPITVGEWHTLAYQEINELTKRGLPGVWTHGFYDGWAPNYMLGIAQFRNSMGKFYETYTSGGADCQIVNLPGSATSKEWFRPNPPVTASNGAFAATSTTNNPECSSRSSSSPIIGRRSSRTSRSRRHAWSSAARLWHRTRSSFRTTSGTRRKPLISSIISARSAARYTSPPRHSRRATCRLSSNMDSSRAARVRPPRPPAPAEDAAVVAVTPRRRAPTARAADTRSVSVLETGSFAWISRTRR